MDRLRETVDRDVRAPLARLFSSAARIIGQDSTNSSFSNGYGRLRFAVFLNWVFGVSHFVILLHGIWYFIILIHIFVMFRRNWATIWREYLVDAGWIAEENYR